MEASLNYFMEMRDINNLGNRHKKSSENLDDKSLPGSKIFVSPNDDKCRAGLTTSEICPQTRKYFLLFIFAIHEDTDSV